MTTPPPGTDPNTDPPKQDDPPKTDPPKSDGSDSTDWKAEAEKWKALSRKNEASAKKLQAIEDAQKSELQKAQERIAALEEESRGSKRASLVAKVGADKKIPSILWDRLKGDTLEELTADADTLIKELGVQQGNPGGGRTQENLQTLIAGGGNGQGRPMTDMNEFMRSQRSISGS